MKDKGITYGKNRKSDNDKYVYAACVKHMFLTQSARHSPSKR